MFVCLFSRFTPRVARYTCLHARAMLAAAGLCCLHVLALAFAVRAPVAPRACNAARAGAASGALYFVRRAARVAVRCAWRTVHASHPLTPTGYGLLAATSAAAVALTLVCALSARDPERPLRPHLRFA